MSKDIFNKYICNTKCKCGLLKAYITAQTAGTGAGTATTAVDVACRAYMLYEQVQTYRKLCRGKRGRVCDAMGRRLLALGLIRRLG